ncbi:hypothetical protein [Alkalicoccus chagannorensis]|uniref:hypothetical protein n=1 Tax=Alkalicoccus chagannorensis TaxID=427072 RepID=UPI000423089C|nr:hypothetical protein [Alkalicoccus chagannorensis]
MGEKPKVDLDNWNQQLIITGMTGLVKDEGYTPREVFMLLDEIEKDTFHALSEIRKGNA